MTARECLRHRWLASNRKPNGSTKSTSTSKPEVAPITPDPSRRAGCSSCPPSTNQKNLRKYLSKSREALFEKVISRSKGQPQENLRKSTLMSRYNKTRRMCESQMSLVSKSRERLMMSDEQSVMPPSLHKSREKLYGLRSLSKSHEVLNLCKTVGALNSDINVPETSPLRGILKTLTRATTTDFSTLADEMRERTDNSSPTVIRGEDNKHQHGDNENDKQHKKSQDQDLSVNVEGSNKPDEIKINVIVSPEIKPLQSVLKFICDNSMNNDKKKMYPLTSEDNNKENLSVETKDATGVEDTTKNIQQEKSNNKEKHRPSPLLTKQLSITQSEEDLRSPDTNIDSLSFTEGTSTSCSEISDEDASSIERITGYISTEEDEPRYTVAQLVSAYNLHQEIVTKCSLEVTMNAEDLESKIPPIIEKVPNKKFPTGPNALSLFIPNIDIASRIKRTPRKKPTMRPAPKKIEEAAEEEIKLRAQDEINTSQKDTKEEEEVCIQTTDRLSEIKLPNKSTKPTCDLEKTVVLRDSKYKVEKSYSKEKCRLSGDSTCLKTFVRSSSISSEASFKSSGASSTVTTSMEELTSDRKPRSNRSSGIASSDGDHPSESWSKGASGASSSRNTDRLSHSTPRPNRKSFCSPRAPAVHSDSKTRRKSSPIMKPFY